uniref:Uncharacterized protein n=1 Tax=Caenorhabditis japonica TaxID=281687 RepID=A0A8R1I5D1_CAEJA
TVLSLEVLFRSSSIPFEFYTVVTPPLPRFSVAERLV